jgi:DNA-binding NtrC family response regulator
LLFLKEERNDWQYFRGAEMGYEGSVLVVDDEIGPRESLRMILHPLYQVQTAANGDEALARLQTQQFDLITLDMRMPGPSGLEVLKQIRTMKTDVEVVIISGYMTPKNTAEAKDWGVSDVINKPFNVTEVMTCVGKLVEKKKYDRKVKGLLETAKQLGVLDEKRGEKMFDN